jgi:hypothetical protein
MLLGFGGETTRPAGHVVDGRQRVALERVARNVGDDEVVEAVVRVA